MKKTALLLLILISLPVFAMPPHPDAGNLVNREYRGIIDTPPIILKQTLSSDGGRIRTSPISSGTIRTLVILIQFSDETIATGNSVYEDMLEGTGSMTMEQYYSDMSNGNLNLDFDVVGPYTASKTLQYYGENDSNDYDLHAAELVGEAVDFAIDAGIDFSLYDNDNDINRNVETVIIVHAGPGEETGAGADTIWSHNWTLSSAASYGDGSGLRIYNDGDDDYIINNYTIQPEYTKTPGVPSIGVFCHEFGHVLGLPDLYDTLGQTMGVGKWSLMSGGSWGSGDGADPAPLLAWEKYEIGGSSWVSINELSTSSEDINIDDIEDSKTGYRINLDKENRQYLILEGKSDSNPWFVPDNGILITQINTDIIESNKYYVNAGTDRVHGVNIIEAISPYYDNAGRGGLWKSFLNPSEYGNMCFSLSTKTELLPSSLSSASIIPVTYYNKNIFIAFISIAFLFVCITRIIKPKIKPVILFILVIPLIFSITACPGGSGETVYPLVDHPNTNYYLSDDIYSKVGNSGIRIYDISSDNFSLDVP